ncbi:hypothetical protein QQZ08_005861 [Neonectria magnoliae]|uniref:Calcineurin-like phosphoesterase domain-containing protein n=1 Tax=Neonectria magnoliae TaxID=2732573 RepID=A0ABR1I2A9_9HYPO
MPPSTSSNDLVWIKDLDPAHLPTSNTISGLGKESGQSTRRLIIIGDVHGHITELRNLLDKLGFNQSKGDHLILTGDLVNKGPNSAAVVQLAMDLGADSVRGNNEDRVLLLKAVQDSSSTASSDKGVASELAHVTIATQNGEAPTEPRTSPSSKESDRATGASLSTSQVAWLSSLPLILRIGKLKGATSPPWNAGTLLVVHAGLVPFVPLEEQSPWAVMNMRSLMYSLNDAQEGSRKEPVKGESKDFCDGVSATLDVGEQLDKKIERAEDGGWARSLKEMLKNDRAVGQPIEGREGLAWSRVWNLYQNMLDTPAERTVIVYGHDALTGLQVEPEVELEPGNEGAGTPVKGARYAFGLDSGCVYGKQLTALVIEADAKTGDIVHRIEQVDSKLQ